VTTHAESVGAIGIDGAALKPAEFDLRAAAELPLDRFVVDYEGREHLPDPDLLADLAASVTVRVTAPVRADGFDPGGDDSLYGRLPESVGLVVVAGNPAYLDDRERSRAVPPRLGAMVERATDPWVGTEGIEQVALATGATQFALLAPGLEREVRALRAAGFDGEFAVYAPTVLSDAPEEILDATGAYVARRPPVAKRLPEGATTDSGAMDDVRDVLLEAAREYALVGDRESVSGRIDAIRAAGVDHVVGYPARGIDAFPA